MRTGKHVIHLIDRHLRLLMRLIKCDRDFPGRHRLCHDGAGDQIGVGAKLRCQNDSCVRCWARETITVGADATTKLVLKPMALGCQFYGDLVFDNPVIGTCNGK